MSYVSLAYSYVLRNVSTEEEKVLDGFAYEAILGEAADHGWEPAGTIEPHEWRGADYDDPYLYQLATDRYRWHLPGSYDSAYHFTPDPDVVWNGNYITDQGQQVAAEDAMALADALQRALDSVPDYDAHTEEVTRSEIEKIESEMIEKFGSLPEYMMSIATEHVRRGHLSEKDLTEVIAFCRKGAFLIH